MKPFFTSPNFWLALIIATGGFFVGFPAGAAGDAVAAIFALVGGGGIMYRFFKEKPAVQVKPWITDANFWNYSTVLAVSVLPVIGPQIMPALEDVTIKIFRGDWGGAIMSFVSLATIVVKILQQKK